MIMVGVDEWYGSLDDAGKDYAQTWATVQVCLQLSELARVAAKDAETNLERANGRRAIASREFAAMRRTASTAALRTMHDRLTECDLSVAAHAVRAASALEMLIRTTTTLQQAIRLHVMGMR
jgi:hypothetical protein